MRGYFPNQKSLGANVKVGLDLSKYATKPDLKNVTYVDTSQNMIDLAILNHDLD